MKYQYTVKGIDYEVEIQDIEGNIANVTVNGIPFEVEMKLPVKAGKQKVKLSGELKESAPTTTSTATATPAATTTAATQPAAAASGKPVVAPLPGTINEIKVKVGDKVNTGDTVVILEAMKMQNNIEAETSGTITSINVNKGDAVMEAAIEIFMALYILDYDRCFQSIYRGQCAERMVEIPRIAGARHANLRGFIYELFLQHGTREIAREFLRQAEARDEGGKRLMLPSVFDHLTDMLVMQHTAEGQPQRNRALPLEQRFARIEAEILRFLGCQHTSPSI